MSIIKIPTVNDSYTGHVTEAREVEGKFGIQACYTFSNGDQLYMPVKSSTIQLLRCGGFDNGQNPPAVEYAAVAGNTLHFSRTANRTENSSPYYNIEIANGAAPAPSKRLPSPTAHTHWPPLPSPTVVPGAQVPLNPDKGPQTAASATDSPSWDALVQSYARAWQTVSQIQGANGTADSVQAGTATLLIAADKRGIVIPAQTKRVAAPLPSKSTYEEPLPEYTDHDSLPF